MSGSLIPMYREMHAAGHFGGGSIRHHLDEIAKLVRQSGAKTLLDYGSGKGLKYRKRAAHQHWGGIMPTLYDPAVRGIDVKPSGTFDGVLCVDVLEHVPEDELDDVLGDLVGYARLWLFASICCAPAKKFLPDGRNVHVTLRPPAWWRERIEAAFSSGSSATPHLVFAV